MKNIKEEHRLLLAFAIAVLIIVLFGKFSQQSKQTPPPSPAPVSVSSPPGAPSVPPVASVGSPACPTAVFPAYTEKCAALENDLFVVTVDPAGGRIRDIGLKHYQRAGETYFYVADDSSALADYPANASETWLAAPYSTTASGYTLTLEAAPAKGLKALKRLEVSPSSYTIRRATEFTNSGREPFVLRDYTILGEALDFKTEAKEKTVGTEIMVNANGTVTTSAVNSVRDGMRKEFDNASWICLKSHYRLLVLRPEKPGRAFIVRSGDSVLFGMLYPELVVEAGGKLSVAASLYAGPSDFFIASKEVPEPKIFGTGPFVMMGRYLFMALNAIHRVVPNWGWAIILLTLIVKAVFFPLSRKGLESMKNMQKLRPYMKDLQAKYKDNPQQMQKELMNLYKEYKINPFSGCIPMLIQLPIFVGFFLALRNSVSLRGAPFMLWIKDLSLPDSIFAISGFSINLLPVIMAGTSYWQQRMTPQEPSQKALVVMMPLMFLVLFYNFSSGLLLYWVTMNVAGLVEQWLINKPK